MPTAARPNRRFFLRGVDLNAPRDNMRDGFYPLVENIYSRQEGIIETRPGLKRINQVAIQDAAATKALHSIARLNDPLADDWNRFWGIGLEVQNGKTVPGSADTGYSGDPLAMVPFRPEQEAKSYEYVWDRSRLSKFNVAGTRFNTGIAPPALPPAPKLDRPYHKHVDSLGSSSGWAIGGTTTGSISGETRIGSTAISTIIYHELPTAGTTGWHTTTLTGFLMPQGPGPGASVVYDSGGGNQEFLWIEEMYPEIPAGVSFGGNGPDITLDSLVYDTGASGWATLQPTIWHENFRIGAMISIDYSGSPLAAVIHEIHEGPDGKRCLRAWLTGTRAAGDEIRVLNSFRAWSAAAHVATESVDVSGLKWNVENGAGYISKPLATPLELSTILSRPVMRDDIVHISIFTADLSKIVEGRVLLDYAQDSVSGGVFTGTEFTKNYAWKSFRPSDLTPVTKGTKTAIQSLTDEVRRSQLEDLGSKPVSNQLELGDSQWSELEFRLADMVKVGTDPGVGFPAVVGLRIEFTVTDSVTGGGGTTVGVDSWDIRGTFGPEVTPGTLPLDYRVRPRSSTTGVTGNPSPPSRVQSLPKRNAVIVAAAVHPDSQVDQLDFFRRGGGVSDWRYVGSVANSGSPSFTDDIETLEAAAAEGLTFDNDQPFTILDTRKTGTMDVCGTVVDQQSGDTFSTSWKPGTIIQIGDGFYTLYQSPLSTTKIILNECAGAQTGVTFTIREPEIMAQPLAHVWGPLDGTFFAVGDSKNAGKLYWLKRNVPDSHPSLNNLDVTGPSEPLINGIEYEGRSYLASSKRWWAIFPKLTGIGFNVQQRPVGKGLWAPWALVEGGGWIYFLSNDGIYRTSGGPAQSLTDEELYDLFPHQDTKTSSFLNEEYRPVAMSRKTDLRLSYSAGWLYFDYKDVNGDSRTLTYNTVSGGWLPYDYATKQVLFHQSEDPQDEHRTLVGSNLGFLYETGGDTDDGTFIACHFHSQAENIGDLHAKVNVADFVVDAAPDGNLLTVALHLDDDQTTTAFTGVTGTDRDTHIVDINNGLGLEARNVALSLNWIKDTGNPRLWGWIPGVYPKPEDRKRRVVEWDEFQPGSSTQAWVTGITLWINTYGQKQTFQVWADGVNQNRDFSITTNGEEKVPNTWLGFRGYLGRLVPTVAGVQFRIHKAEWYAASRPTESTAIDTDFQPVGEGGGVEYVTGLRVEMDTKGVDKLLEFQFELEGTVSTVVPVDGGTINRNGRRTKTFTFNPPILAHRWRMFSGDTVPAILYNAGVLSEAEPEFLTSFGQNWSDAGYPGEKFVVGIVIEADTKGETKEVRIEIPGGTGATVSVDHAIRDQRHYFFEPFVNSLIRPRAVDTKNAQFYGFRLIWEPVPKLSTRLVTQPTTFDIPGFSHIRRGFLAYSANSNLRLKAIGDGREHDFVFGPFTNAKRFARTQYHWPPNKAKEWRFELDCDEGARVYRRDSQLFVKPWGSGGSYLSVQPFGGQSRTKMEV